MTPEDKKFVREMSQILAAPKCYLLRSEANRLMSILNVSEAMREKAEFERLHWSCLSDGDYCVIDNFAPRDLHHDWTDADWIAQARKELVE